MTPNQARRARVPRGELGAQEPDELQVFPNVDLDVVARCSQRAGTFATEVLRLFTTLAPDGDAHPTLLRLQGDARFPRKNTAIDA